jgi:hypothetical protein
MTNPYPRYIAYNDRPVKIMETADGGLDVIGLDMSRGDGEWVPDYEALTAYYGGGDDIDELTKEQFDEMVTEYRAAKKEGRPIRGLGWRD